MQVRWRGAPSLILTQIARDKEAGAHQKREIRSRGQCFCTWAACTLKKRLTLEKLSSYWSAGQCENVRTQQAAHVHLPEITLMNFSGITERSSCLNIYIVQDAERRLCCVWNLILIWKMLFLEHVTFLVIRSLWWFCFQCTASSFLHACTDTQTSTLGFHKTSLETTFKVNCPLFIAGLICLILQSAFIGMKLCTCNRFSL